MGIVFHHEEITVEENRQRNEYLRRYYNPETGEGGDTGDRRILRLPDAPIPVQYIPKALFDNEMMAQRLVECGSLAGYAERYGHDKIIATDEAGRNPKLADGGDATEELWREWIRVRIRYDFEFWAFSFVRIKDKLGAEDIPFRLNRPQRRILGMLEDMRTAGKPIRLILLKARQWGGSTLVQIYMAWIQLVHCRNWNSVICAHLKESAAKALVIDAQKNALREGSYIEHDTQACYEHDVYERKPNGSYGAMEGHHDDILITRCIGNYICSRELPSASSKGHRSERIVNESSI